MKDKDFEILLGILRILEKNGLFNNMEVILEIINNFDFELTVEQRSKLMRDILKSSKPKSVEIELRNDFDF